MNGFVHSFVFFCIMLNVFKLNEMKIIFLVILPPSTAEQQHKLSRK